MLNSLQLIGAGVPAVGAFRRVLLSSSSPDQSNIAIPNGVFVIRVKCWGAPGAGNSSAGDGGFSVADIPVTPGEILTYLIGEFGVFHEGGGYSGLFRGTPSQANALIIAGGGGAAAGGSGGNGGGTTGQTGVSQGGDGGGGGTQAAAGASGNGTDLNGNAGSGMNGGAHVGGGTGSTGGGGSGYYGGGSGGKDLTGTFDTGGGGGGSGFVSGINAATQQGIAGTTTDVDYEYPAGSGDGVGQGRIVIRA